MLGCGASWGPTSTKTESLDCSVIADFSIPALLERRASQQPDAIAYTFVDYATDPAGETESLTWSELHDRVTAIAGHLGRHGSPGDRAVVLAPQGLEYIVGFLGAIEAGFIAVPLPVPQPGQHDDRVVGALLDSNPAAVLTTSELADDIRSYVREKFGQRLPRVVEIDAVEFDGRGAATAAPPVTKTAYLQYTSGSTRQPAGVAMSHRNITANLEQVFADYLEHVDIDPTDLTVVSWAPLYHDMGLVLGVFVPLATGCPAVLMAPVAFMQKPARWMQNLAAHRNAFTAAPNFAYELALTRTSDEDMAGRDLSGVVVMINGAERVLPSTVGRFNDRFASFGLPDSALRTTYGLAEATVYVVSSEGGKPPRTVRFDSDTLNAGRAEQCLLGGVELVTAGVPRSSEVRIVDRDSGREVPDGVLGEIWVHGDQVASGYWRNPELRANTFGGELSDPTPGTPRGPWLRTGDLGVLHDGDLFMIGRIKDLLIVDGRNHYPDDIETTVRAVTGGRVAAVAIPEESGEKLVVVAEVKDPGGEQSDAIGQQVTAAVSSAHGVRVGELVLAPPGSIPVTTSGKVQRSACAERYRSGRFAQ